jgi:hypothetical protein
MIRGLSQYLDQQFTDPTVAAVPGVSPASITNGAPSIASSNAASDIKALIAAFTAANPNAQSMVLLMSPSVATAMAIATNNAAFGGDGTRLFGVPVYIGHIGSRVIILDPTALLIADDGDMDVIASRSATVELDTSATSPPVASTTIVSLWQVNLIGLRVERFINWRMARANAVYYTNVSYT